MTADNSAWNGPAAHGRHKKASGKRGGFDNDEELLQGLRTSLPYDVWFQVGAIFVRLIGILKLASTVSVSGIYVHQFGALGRTVMCGSTVLGLNLKYIVKGNFR